MSTKGALAYVSAKDLEGLRDARSYLSGILEAASGDVSNLTAAMEAISRIDDKVSVAQQRTHRSKRRSDLVAELLRPD